VPEAMAAQEGWWHVALIEVDGRNTVVLHAEPTRSAIPCPTCGHLSARRHSWYRRRPLDLPWRGATVRLVVRSRRLFCDNPTCPRKIFAERFDGVLPRHARRTEGVTALLVEFGLRAGGEAGARLARKAGIPTSPDTLLRLVRDLGKAPVPTPRVLGIDDFALRRGQAYGTLLVDLEHHVPVDVLKTREAEPLVAWLQAHPGVQVLVRDRAGAYADAGRRGAPTAVQVVDRFHLCQNVSAALDEVVRSRRRRVEMVTCQIEAEPSIAVPTPPPRPPGARRQAQLAARAQRMGRWEQARALRAQGHSLSAIARELGINRKTVRQLVRTTEPPRNPSRPPCPTGLRSPSLQPFVPYLQARWQEGCHCASQLHRELVAQGCRTSRTLLIQAVRAWRDPTEASARRRGPPKRRRQRRLAVRWLCLRPPEQLDEVEHEVLARVLAEDAELAGAYSLVQRFRRLIRDRDLRALDRWLTDATASGLAPFMSVAHGIRHDRAAVTAAFVLPWSTGPVEGEIHKVKLLKRQGYGRATMPLLRAKILAA
jgi:transposase